MNRTKRHLIVLAVFLLMAFKGNADTGARRAELIKVIDMQIREIVRLGKSVRNNPQALLQLAELYLEKARHIKDIENEKFLKIPAKKARRINRSQFFRRSRSYVSKAERYCRTIIKKFPRYPYKGDVYYIMAFNAKEFGNYRKAQQYFAMASRQRSSDPNIKLKAHIALADILYNQSHFSKAARQYELGLSKKIDQWWTKDAYNLAWCYYQMGKYRKGITLLQEVNTLSKRSNYIDMSDQATRDLARFYVQAGMIKQAVSFYKRNISHPEEKLAQLGDYLIGQSKYTQAIPILEDAKRIAGGNVALKRRINFSLAKSYSKYGRYRGLLATTQELMADYKANTLDKKQRKTLHELVKRNFGIIQNNVTGKMYQSHPKKRLALARITGDFGAMMKVIEPKKVLAYTYLTAEAFYSAKDYSTAKSYYSQSLELAKRERSKNYIKLSLDGVAACVNNSGNQSKDDELIGIYNGYLALNPSNTKANKIYQRLFTLQMKKGDLTGAEETFNRFRKHFRRNYKQSEAMLAQMMDHYLKKDDKANFGRLYKSIADNKIPISKKYAIQLKKVALGLQFQDVQKASSDGEKKKALVLYVGIYRDKNSSAEAKKTAAYNIMRMFYMLGDSSRMYQWAQRALTHMNRNDVLKYETSFSKLALELFERRRFDHAYNLYHDIYRRLCRTDAEIIQDGYNNMMVILLSKKSLNRSERKQIDNLLLSSGKCGINPRIVHQIRFDLMKRYLDDGAWWPAVKQYNVLKRMASFWPQLIAPAYTLYTKIRRKSFASDANKFFNYALKKGKSVDIQAANSIYQLRKWSFYRVKKQFDRIKLRFPVNTYNKLLERKFKILAQMMTQGVKLVNLGSSVGVVDIYKQLIMSYSKLIDEVERFTPPKKSAEFIKSFKSSMRGVIQALSIKRGELYRDAKSLITKHEILDEDNLFFYPEYDKTVNHSSIYSGLIMDRGGLR